MQFYGSRGSKIWILGEKLWTQPIINRGEFWEISSRVHNRLYLHISNLLITISTRNTVNTWRIYCYTVLLYDVIGLGRRPPVILQIYNLVPSCQFNHCNWCLLLRNNQLRDSNVEIASSFDNCLFYKLYCIRSLIINRQKILFLLILTRQLNDNISKVPK